MNEYAAFVVFVVAYGVIGVVVAYVAWRLDPRYIEAGRWITVIASAWPFLVLPCVVVPLVRRVLQRRR